MAAAAGGGGDSKMDDDDWEKINKLALSLVYVEYYNDPFERCTVLVKDVGGETCFHKNPTQKMIREHSKGYKLALTATQLKQKLALSPEAFVIIFVLDSIRGQVATGSFTITWTEFLRIHEGTNKKIEASGSSGVMSDAKAAIMKTRSSSGRKKKL